MEDIVIVEAKRTPVGSFGGALSSFSAPELGASVAVGVIKSTGIQPSQIDEVVFGNVLTAGIGQAPARQVALKAGLPNTTPATTVNKVCASGMKSVMYAANQIKVGEAEVVLAGGMESMSNVPYYLPKHRFGSKMGNVEAIDGMIHDGLWDVYNDYHMGKAGELCATELCFSRAEQDDFAKESYKRSQEADQKGYFDNEITPLKVRSRKAEVTVVDTDEEPSRVKFDKISSLRPVFKKEGTITAANASTINDGAAALLVMSASNAKELQLTPIARIMSQSSAAKAPEWFTTAPAAAIPKAVKSADLTINDIDLFEINEAFAVVTMANNKLLNISSDIVNIHGGAVSLGHPLGCSGARIIVTLLHALKRVGKKIGCAGICNGGGGASAMVVEILA